MFFQRNFVCHSTKKADVLLLFFSVCSVAYSLLLIGSMQRSGDYNYLIPQIAALAIGGTAAVLTAAADYRWFVRKWSFFAIAAAVLTGSVFLFGRQVGGTDDTAWLELPGGFSVQPSEFVKICFIITFAAHLSWLAERDRLKELPAFLSLLAHAAIPVGLIHWQGDDGTALVFGAIYIVMSLAAGVRLRYFAILGGLILGSVPVLWRFVMNDAHRSRLLALFDREGNALTEYGWQQYQGRLSIGSGSLFGKGLFHGDRVGIGIVPEQENDFILTVSGEELGFLGCITVLLLLFAVTLRLLYDAAKTRDVTGRSICAGVFAMVAFQTVVNLGMVTGLLPVIGVTLPLFSAGGSSLISVCIGIGLAESVCMHNEPDMNRVQLAKMQKKTAQR